MPKPISVTGLTWMAMRLALRLLAISLLYGSAAAQEIETPTAPTGSPAVSPYLEAGSVDYHDLIEPPPAVHSEVDDVDMQVTIRLQRHTDYDRWSVAVKDDAYVYARFAGALGSSLDRQHIPATVAMLNRAMRDVADPIFAAKRQYHRPRPYQRIQLARVCGERQVPMVESAPSSGDSYPSGHSAYGWTTALVLALVAPERREALLQRAAEYEQSRVICGVHFESDVEAGRVIAVDVVERLKTVPQFQTDLAAAQQEWKAVSRAHRQ